MGEKEEHKLTQISQINGEWDFDVMLIGMPSVFEGYGLGEKEGHKLTQISQINGEWDL